MGPLYFLELKETVSSIVNAGCIILTNVLKLSWSCVPDCPVDTGTVLDGVAPPIGLLNRMGLGIGGWCCDSRLCPGVGIAGGRRSLDEPCDRDERVQDVLNSIPFTSFIASSLDGVVVCDSRLSPGVGMAGGRRSLDEPYDRDERVQDIVKHLYLHVCVISI